MLWIRQKSPSEKINKQNLGFDSGIRSLAASLRGVHVDYHEKQCSIKALEQIDLDIYRGEIVFISGPSGAGKSTLLKILEGVLKPTRGNAILSGGELFTSSIRQHVLFDEAQSLRKNMVFSYDPKIYQSFKQFSEEMQTLCELMGIEKFLDLPAQKANGGLRQVVGSIRALLAKPDILLADEPTSSLDETKARRLFDLYNYYSVKRGLTVVWASHQKQLLDQLTGRMIYLDAGKLIYAGNSCFI